jgi:cytochrome c-type biogenesis protein CcmE
MHGMNIIAMTACLVVGACTTSEPPRRADAPAVAQAETVLEGALEVLVVDSAQGSRTLYFLLSRDQRIPLRFDGAVPSNVRTGMVIRVRGHWEKETFVVTAIERT